MTYVGLSGGADSAVGSYGREAARGMIAHIRRLPPGQRSAAMRTAMAKIDPTLAARAEKHALEARRAGLPAAKALEHGVARGIGEGVVSELARLGRTRNAPARNSLLGLGCYRAPSSLGAVISKVGTFTAPLAPIIANVAPAGCGNPPSGYTWQGDHWERPRAGAPLSPGPFAVCIDARTGAPGAPTRQQLDDAKKALEGKKIQVGPFVIPADLTTPFVITAHDPSVIPADWKPFIRKVLIPSPAMLEIDKVKQFQKFLDIRPAPQNPFWQALGVSPGEQAVFRSISPAATMGKWTDNDDGLAMPIATFEHPVSGNKWGVFVAMLPTKESPTSIQLYFKWIPVKAWYSRAFDWIIDLPAKLIDAVGDAINWVKDATCKLVDKLAPIAAQAGAAPDPQTQAIGAGAMIASSLCSGGGVPPPPTVLGSSNTLLYLLLGGGAVIGLALYSRSQ